MAEREEYPPIVFGDGEADAQPLVVGRPLLTVSRADTVAYCEARGISWRTDESNTDPRMLRNRVRGHLLPVLRTYNPAIDRALARTAAAVTEDERWLTELIARLWRRLAREDNGAACIGLASWRRQPVAVQRRLVRHFAEQIGFWEIGFEAVERALHVGTPDGPPRAELGGGVTVERRGGHLRLSGLTGWFPGR
jgi:tRNA(Ile)-lysidine synthase